MQWESLRLWVDRQWYHANLPCHRYRSRYVSHAGIRRIRASAVEDLGVILHWKDSGALRCARTASARPGSAAKKTPATYDTRPSVNLGVSAMVSPLSSRGGLMLKVCRMEATVSQTEASPKCLPGQILQYQYHPTKVSSAGSLLARAKIQR